MIGIIVTGHGSFASGLTSGLMLLAGEPKQYEAVDFEPEDSVEGLTDKLNGALERLKACEEIAVFTDLTGGSPFNVAVRLKMTGDGRSIEVTGNTNLPVVIQAYLSRTMYSDAASLMDASLEAGKIGMVRFEPAKADEADEVEDIE